MRIVVAQLPFPVGALDDNARRIIDAIGRARDEFGADLVVFPELAVTGYPPDDLLLRSDFHAAVERALARIAAACTGVTALVGAPLHRHGVVRNAAVALADGAEVGAAYKRCLPSYSVFDDNRHFRAGDAPCLLEVAGRRIGVAICEDIWAATPAAEAAAAGAELLVSINASPFHDGKQAEREGVAARRVAETGVPLLYANLVGGHDEVVYDGGSFALDDTGALSARAPAFADGLYALDWQGGALHGEQAEAVEGPPAVYQALVRATADYVRGNGFSGVVLGLSGGIDSALVAAVAADALGGDRVLAVMMPTRYTAERSLEDARAAAQALGLEYRSIPIESLFADYEQALAPLFAGREADATEENIQARIRGNCLMALSNKLGLMLLAAGNKSELAVGYATLYGDMCGGFAPLKDVYKTDVYRLAEYRNSLGPAVPAAIIEREPTAELRADQRDSDSLPPYRVLDAVLRQYLEDDAAEHEIRVEGLDAVELCRVIRLLYRNEYKRRQAAPGVKVTRRAFGRDRRYPITSGWSGCQGCSD
ncbi:NAD+ synthase [Halorhodospira halophila]|uniref:Glutamine-dependent NAD(+) synthetase n=1 Tax=Halorhodospira halophila (strain DSM 244 / SL1) TaxID=349124 RepID=A1WZ90_HALHL|nr:NAD+ synthase [Halorhodospira halophila]ABM63002.1 DNA-directed RNA polymerase, subunit H [Halorhodospira halophila SL1]MBK1727877.1 NAD+ synthase [Halorhodospira halophila]